MCTPYTRLQSCTRLPTVLPRILMILLHHGTPEAEPAHPSAVITKAWCLYCVQHDSGVFGSAALTLWEDRGGYSTHIVLQNASSFTYASVPQYIAPITSVCAVSNRCSAVWRDASHGMVAAKLPSSAVCPASPVAFHNAESRAFVSRVHVA